MSAVAVNKDFKPGLAIAALGVVYGDIGTSPLYAFRESLAAHALGPTQASVLGILSLIFWAILVVVTMKYVVLVMRADNKGEGGILALLALALRSAGKSPGTRRFLMVAGLLGAALFYGDAIITPAISVLSAVEGLGVATPFFKPYVIPITLVVLIALFALQRHGTARLGKYFGPIMTLWFILLAGMGLWQLTAYPQVLSAINPIYAGEFIMRHGSAALLPLGAIVLVVTGAEALYADMGHFGVKPIRISWYGLVLPALLLNYFGQGALVLTTPATVTNPFFFMLPEWCLLPLCALATAATVIASQAVISGAYSLTQQAFQLGYLPRLEIIHTSESERGQIYLPAVNWMLLGAIVGLVLWFQSSSKLAAAYGIAVISMMLIDTLLLFFVARGHWQWHLSKTILVISFFLVVDLLFFGASSLKIVEGGWVPLGVGVVVYTVMSTWGAGRTILFKTLYPKTRPLQEFIAGFSETSPLRVPGTAVYLAAPGEGVPHALVHNLRHNQVLHERVIVLTILVEDVPRIDRDDRYALEDLAHNFYLLTARFGFMEFPDVPKVLDECQPFGLKCEISETSFFLSRLRVIPTGKLGMALWRERLFAVMLKNAAHATDFFRIPSSRVMELDLRLEI
ncbi:MAG: potassium transporter Kup [Methyloceanibacter sp.]|nr:potassium transporter Kup [Methyloceanibacter sp.]